MKFYCPLAFLFFSYIIITMKGHAFAKQQKSRHKHHFGFTIIEVSMYLAITAMLFVGIAMTTQSRIENQRYDESVNDFAEFLRNVYSEVENTQNVKYGSAGTSYRKGCTTDSSTSETLTVKDTGQSNCAFYGKVIIFEQNEDRHLNNITVADLIGETIEHGDSLSDKFKKLSSPVRQLVNNDENSVFGSLLAVRAGFRARICTDSTGTSCSEDFAAGHYEYSLPYDYRIEDTNNKNEEIQGWSTLTRGIMIIARAPSDNQIHTLWYYDKFNDYCWDVNPNPTECGTKSNIKTSKLSKYSMIYDTDISGTLVPSRRGNDFCIDQNHIYGADSNNRRNIRILPELSGTQKVDGKVVSGEEKGTGTSSPGSVVVIAQDSDRNITSENNGYYGNRCKW